MQVEYKKYNDPWDHILLPDLLPVNMLDIAETVAAEKLDFKTPNHKSMVNYPHDQSFNSWFLDLYPFFCDILEIKQFQPVKLIFQYTCYNNWDDSTRYDDGIHTDSFDKQFSCLIPLSVDGSGTMLYDENKNLVKQIDWKKNTAFLFANKPHHWHSVGLANGTSRCLLNVIYMPKNYSMHHEAIYNVKRTREHLKR